MTETISETVIDITVDYINKKGWQDFQPFELIIHNLISPPLPFSSKEDFLVKALQTWHHNSLLSLPTFDQSITLHERFFEVFMTRFEILNSYKKFLQQVCDPSQLVLSSLQNYAVPWWHTISELYDYIIDGQVDTNLLRYKKLFIWFYVKSLPVWFSDQSPDLAATMSALDTNIHKFLNTISRLP